MSCSLKILISQGIGVGGADLDRRLLCITKEIVDPREQKCRVGQLDKAREPFSIQATPFWDLGTAEGVSIFYLLDCYSWYKNRPIHQVAK